MRCKDLQYRFAGAKNKRCVCGDNIKIGTKISTCEQKCPGDETELCGGDFSISLYATGAETTKRTTSTTRTTTKIKRQTRSQITHKVPSAACATKDATSDAFVTENTTSDYFKTETSTIVVSSVTDDMHVEDAASTAVIAACISIPSVIIIVVVTVLIICLITRRRRIKHESYVKYHENPPTNDCHISENGTTNIKLLKNSNANNVIPNIRQGIQDTAQSRIYNDNNDAEYSTVDPGNTLESDHQYGYFKTHPSDRTSARAIYSHLQLTQGVPKVSPAENAYSHIGACILLEQPKHSKNEADNSYNSLRSTQRTNDANKMSNDNGDQDSIYDNAIVGGKLPVRIDILNNEYAQLKTVNTKKTVKEQEQSTANREIVVDKEVNNETGFYEQVDEADHQYYILEPGK